MGADCTFCKIMGGDMPADVVYRDEEIFVMLDHRPLLPGHCLLMPRKHIETLLDVPADGIGDLFSGVKRLARAVQSAMESGGSFVAINNYVSQSVPHLHVHVVPRWRNDGLFSRVMTWKRGPYESEEEAALIRDRIHAAFLAAPL